MNKRSYYGLLYGVFLYGMTSCAVEYIYPIMNWLDNDQEIIFFTHQVGQKITLWSFNNKTGHQEQLVSSQYNPVGVRILPDKSGFSFLDNGLIKVKKFLKRSPRTIEIYEPIYYFGIPEWLADSYTCFFHAKQANNYGIYQLTLDGVFNTVIRSSSSDYIYPQKVDQDLFFIERTNTGNYSVRKTPYSTSENDKSLDRKSEQLYNFNTKNIMYLLMTNADKGFVIEYIPTQDSQTFTFKFHTLKCTTQNSWRAEELFTFYLPSYFFIDKTRMICDSIPALFPRVTESRIYFISFQEQENDMMLYLYNEKIQSIEKVHTVIPIPKDIAYVRYAHCKNILMPIITHDGLLRGCALD